MSMTSGTIERGAERTRGQTRSQTVLRVSESGRYVGDVLLDGRKRLWRRADTIPADVVLKLLIAFTRHGEVCGQLVGLSDGRPYLWHVVGALPVGPAAEIC